MRSSDRSAHKQTLTALAISFLLVGGATGGGSETGPKGSDNSAIRPRQPSRGYCGIYCLYAAMRALHVEVAPESLLKPEYVGSVKGSTLAELRRAAEERRLYAGPVGKLTTRSLSECPPPMILHVKDQAASKEYNHYELFLGMEGRKAKLLNPPEPIRLVPLPELDSRWDGNALIVSAKPIDLGRILIPARRRFAFWTSVAFGIVLLIRLARHSLALGFLRSRRALVPRSLAQSSGLIAVTVLGGLLYHCIADEGMLANAKATEAIQLAHANSFIPKINHGTVRTLLGRGTVFIDARFSLDYQKGHVQGAINIPVNANEAQRRQITASLSKDARVVVYCQSRACPFAEKVAVNLKEDGFSDVVVYRGGWVDWVARNGRSKS